MIRMLALLLTVLTLAAAPAGAHVTRTVTEDYIGGGPAVGLCRQDTGEDVNIAAACFDVDPSEDLAVQLSAVDLVSPSVGFFYYIHDAAGNCADEVGDDCRSAGFACNDSPVVAIPASASGIYLIVLEPALATFGCAFVTGEGTFGAAVAGTVTATFYD